MGNDFCNETDTIDNNQLDDNNYNEETMERAKKFNDNRQVSIPQPELAVKVDSLSTHYSSQALTKLQERLSKIMKHEKSNHLKLKISKQPKEINQLKDAYLIKCSNEIYIGEWVTDNQLMTSVPGGIGRLYTDSQILEGSLQSKVTSINDEYREREIDVNANITKKFVNNKQDRQFFNVEPQKKEPDNKVASHSRYPQQSEQKREKPTILIEITLEGEGRIFSRQKELSGVFKNNKLNGKGICRFRQKDLNYEYIGEFKDGKKHGKGFEKIGKLIYYDGDFENDKKQGSGVLVLEISEAYMRERQAEQKELLNQEKQADPNLKIKKISKYIRTVQDFENQLQKQLIKNALTWVKPEAPPSFKSIRNSEMFVMEHIQKTKFLQNYKGEFSNNQFSGSGTYNWFNGKCYHGMWVKGKMEGYGQFYWPDGTYYRGQYRNDLRHGKGEMIFSPDKRFRGNFILGLKHGYGELITVIQKQRKSDESAKDLIEYDYELRVKGSLYRDDKEIQLQAREKQAYFDLTINEKCNFHLKQLKDLKTKTQMIVKNLVKVKQKN